ELEVVLTEYFAQFRKVMRSIPASIYLELAESADDPIRMKTKLQEAIDEGLRQIGTLDYEREEQDIESSEEDSEDDSTTTEDDTE
ncbi:hypothetical protein V4Z89_005984, partial [Klebsiella pneumoniae]